MRSFGRIVKIAGPGVAGSGGRPGPDADRPEAEAGRRSGRAWVGVRVGLPGLVANALVKAENLSQSHR